MDSLKRSSIQEIEAFDKETSLRSVKTELKNPLPTVNDLYAELLPEKLEARVELKEIKHILDKGLHHTQTQVKNVLPSSEDIKMDQHDILTGIKNYDKSDLLHVQVEDSKPLPTAGDIRAELRPDHVPSIVELQNLQDHIRFYLCHIDTVEKNVLPTKEDIQLEAINSLSEVKYFDKNKLKHVQVEEKSTLPTDQELRMELIPKDMPSKMELEALKRFSKKDLKKVETAVKDNLPTIQDIVSEMHDPSYEIKHFNWTKLKHVETTVKDNLPTSLELFSIKNFLKNSLHHVEPRVSNTLPSTDDISSEKKLNNSKC